ncbi:beta-ketoacyl synthase N-terminal-like domain-containing protein [Kitasatospora sp. P5_F3]
MIAVTGYAVHVPGASAEDLLGAVADPAGMWPADEVKHVLGRKGLLFKEPATRLALCAAQRALGLPDGPVTGPVPGADRTAVVVSSNLGNVHTVTDIVRRVQADSFKEVSPLDTPNASSNVIASTIAIRFGITGPNFMLCNGATSGLDAVRLGARLLRADRADRVLVVGVEPADETATALAARRDPAAFGGREPRPLREAAAAVLLSRADRGVLIDAAGSGQPPSGEDDLALVAYGRPLPAEVVVDLTGRLGETYGAQGVLQVACATAWLTSRGYGTAVLSGGDAVEGHGWLRLSVQGER